MTRRMRASDREMLSAVESLLRSEWDPIGCGVPDDEYDSYAGQVFSKLLAGNSAEDISRYLDHIVAESMGLGLTEAARERNRLVAARAVELSSAWRAARG